jgi:hypothetical protein
MQSELLTLKFRAFRQVRLPTVFTPLLTLRASAFEFYLKANNLRLPVASCK